MNLNVSDRYFTWPELSCFGEDPILSASNQIECLVCVGLHLSVGSEHIVTCLVTFSISKNKHCLLKKAISTLLCIDLLNGMDV